MFRERAFTLAWTVIATCGLAGCLADAAGALAPDAAQPSPTADAGPKDAAIGGDAAAGDAAPSTLVDPTSRHPQLLAKDGEQLSRDLAVALGLGREEVCRELGAYDCASVAHRIVLGGVEPYVLRVDQPLSSTPVTAPIAVDRVALSACGARASRDFADPARAVVFGALARGEAGAVEATVEALYDRLLARDPDPDERAAVASLATDTTPRDFAILACFTIATTLESLFY